MIVEYVSEALKRARYEMIEDKEPFYGEVSGLKGVWATGETLEECREHLGEVLDGWIARSPSEKRSSHSLARPVSNHPPQRTLYSWLN